MESEETPVSGINAVMPCEDDDDFFFETESLALKGNKDYLKLLRTLCILESQRLQALKDIDKLLEIQDQALSNPIEFVYKLERGDDIGVPCPQTVPEVPEIDWSKYKVSLPPEAFRPQTRQKERPITEIKEKPDVIKVRGRVYDNSKPITFNQLWTLEEQLRLEELLVKFPPEKNETRRYMKIAEALGNRTVTQVTSRCQKYFLKLQKAGLPVPGRIPKLKSDYLRSPKYAGHQHSRNNSFLYPRSTFFPQLNPPVSMPEVDDLPGTSVIDVNLIKMEPKDAEEDNIYPEDVKNSDEFKKLALLKRIKRDKEKNINSVKFEHVGYKCNGCMEEPILGTRWHCYDCDPRESIDFCSECLISQLESEKPHSLSHHFLAINTTQQNGFEWDKDYSYQKYFHGGYNYLDPNFMPQ
ncbi:hypothetical protein RUM44_009930 [Polyplax serrata]|uniref:ZZ-type domain-containing protein n=1 Tax=Polyplax serrata TaxID=468196 RepID=A0ABR1AUB7_POLSC